MSFASESRERTRPTLPLAAMVDVLFLLLVFFMTASVFRERETQIDINLPTAETAETQKPGPTRIVVSIDENNEIYLGERKVLITDLPDTLKKLAADFPDEELVVRGDQESSFGLAVRIMDEAKQAGISNVSVATIKSVEEIE